MVLLEPGRSSTVKRVSPLDDTHDGVAPCRSGDANRPNDTNGGGNERQSSSRNDTTSTMTKPASSGNSAKDDSSFLSRNGGNSAEHSVQAGEHPNQEQSTDQENKVTTKNGPRKTVLHSQTCRVKDVVLGQCGFQGLVYCETIELYWLSYLRCKTANKRNVARKIIEIMCQKGCRFLVPYGHDEDEEQGGDNTHDDSSLSRATMRRSSADSESVLYEEPPDSKLVQERVMRSLRRMVAEYQKLVRYSSGQGSNIVLRPRQGPPMVSPTADHSSPSPSGGGGSSSNNKVGIQDNQTQTTNAAPSGIPHSSKRMAASSPSTGSTSSNNSCDNGNNKRPRLHESTMRKGKNLRSKSNLSTTSENKTSEDCVKTSGGCTVTGAAPGNCSPRFTKEPCALFPCFGQSMSTPSLFDLYATPNLAMTSLAQQFFTMNATMGYTANTTDASSTLGTAKKRSGINEGGSPSTSGNCSGSSNQAHLTPTCLFGNAGLATTATTDTCSRQQVEAEAGLTSLPETGPAVATTHEQHRNGINHPGFYFSTERLKQHISHNPNHPMLLPTDLCSEGSRNNSNHVDSDNKAKNCDASGGTMKADALVHPGQVLLAAGSSSNPINHPPVPASTSTRHATASRNGLEEESDDFLEEIKHLLQDAPFPPHGNYSDLSTVFGSGVDIIDHETTKTTAALADSGSVAAKPSSTSAFHPAGLRTTLAPAATSFTTVEQSQTHCQQLRSTQRTASTKPTANNLYNGPSTGIMTNNTHQQVQGLGNPGTCCDSIRSEIAPKAIYRAVSDYDSFEDLAPAPTAAPRPAGLAGCVNRNEAGTMNCSKAKADGSRMISLERENQALMERVEIMKRENNALKERVVLIERENEAFKQRATLSFSFWKAQY